MSGKLTRNAKIAYSFSNLKNGSLIYIGQLCDDDCVAIFSKYDVKIKKDNKILIRGRRTDNRLWKLPMCENYTPSSTSDITVNTTAHVANGVIKLDSTKDDLAKYYAATLFNPTKSAMLRAIYNNHLTLWPALSTKMIRKYLHKRLELVQGHLHQEFQNIRSTKLTLEDIKDNNDLAPAQEPNNSKKMMLCAQLCQQKNYVNHILTGQGNYQ